jgi:hypothetical protein
MRNRLGGFLICLACLSMISACDIIDPEFESPLSPPSWIIGRWDDAGDVYYWVFSADNAVLFISPDTVVLDFKALAQQPGKVVTDTRSVSTYSVIVQEGSDIYAWNFNKLSDTTLDYWTEAPGGNTGPFVLTKQ